ncbi:Sec-independent protein translocase protein TatB [Aquisalimonas asiatica]|uniref:Sec-independent protein translocase protein TatB n=1 Tax=Aquisalimonas asiatica TaxID=406100 RepID=A0A1H8TCI7_9GAMM|nr:Sec-independent protein translocase protein TatB [Aquisalimonas asiatica]SEO88193.1 sec-independent protein translocase protein TatB [Aquisalimonas asiatica]
MFDISFPEMLLILVVALVVIGPERLPRVARTMGMWVGRARSVFNSVKRDVEREARLDDLRKAERDFRKDLDLGLDEDVTKGERTSAPIGASKKKTGKGASGGKGRPSIADVDAPAGDGAADGDDGVTHGETAKGERDSDGNT